MEIQNNRNVGLDANATGLASILGVPSVPAYGAQQGTGNGVEWPSLDGDWATLSAAGSGIARAAGDPGVREDKVAAVRSALATGTYMVPAQAVAGRAVGAMLGEGA